VLDEKLIFLICCFCLAKFYLSFFFVKIPCLLALNQKYKTMRNSEIRMLTNQVQRLANTIATKIDRTNVDPAYSDKVRSHVASAKYMLEHSVSSRLNELRSYIDGITASGKLSDETCNRLHFIADDLGELHENVISWLTPVSDNW
jgi:hypothetical protein